MLLHDFYEPPERRCSIRARRTAPVWSDLSAGWCVEPKRDPRGTEVNRNFSQTITVHCPDLGKLIELIERWDDEHAAGDITSYMGTRVLADRSHLGRYMIIVDFGVIDPDVSAAEEAARHNERPETKAMAAATTAIMEGEPEYHDYDEVYRTDF